VEPESFAPVERSPEPRLIFVGRLKAYKRVELLLDVLDELPGVALDVVGEGDHRPDIEAEITRRGLRDRVHMHGYVDGARKAELYGRAWVNVTASASEGWSLTVMEAALCATPSAALAVGGLTESIIDGETGYLARDVPELTARVRELLEDAELRDRLGRAAESRARSFTWDRSAATFLEVLRRAGGAPAPHAGEAPGSPSSNGSTLEASGWVAGKR
jgi:glycosyltransferase involved in cell wall biosynthesis